MPPCNILILGGTGEASALADLLVGDDRFNPMLSLAGRTATPRLPPIPWRSGGFGGLEGLKRYLIENSVQALIVATHPFAVQMRQNAVIVARATRIPVLMIERPAWKPGDGDRWTEVPDMQQAAAALGEIPRRVLLTIGRQDLAPFTAAPWHDYTIRSVEAPPPESLPPRANIIIARGPFTEVAERQMLTQAEIEVIVTKNSGGAATEAKLHAARALGINVVMVARPRWPDTSDLNVGIAVDAPGALRWLDQLHPAESPAKRGV